MLDRETRLVRLRHKVEKDPKGEELPLFNSSFGSTYSSYAHRVPASLIMYNYR
jgi:hypothetical protein